ncbi:2OG-Fe(II) oxygenase [Candidatus Pelagibacter sp.]|nr:2OG-Fe(II) oxygenase [Candidatus Pelagibacter sp.]
MFQTTEEKNIFKNYIKKGFLIFNIKNTKKLDYIRREVVNNLKKNTQSKLIFKNESDFLNNVHKILPNKKINQVRLNLFNKLNSNKNFRPYYYGLVKEYLDKIVGNELAMQRKINLSVQLPNDSSSLLPIHSDTWSGDSPFETVVWLPLVDCNKTKTMYILPPNKMNLVNSLIKKKITTDKLFSKIKKHVIWIKIKYGQVLIFNQNLPHGNVVNKEKETRFSFNCRFKSIFAPYGDKKIGEFFDPITLKPASKIGMIYKYPKI